MTDVSPEMVERMIALVRSMNYERWVSGPCSGVGKANPHYDTASAIAAELPAPVDPDLVEAREVAGSVHDAADYKLTGQDLRRGLRDEGMDIKIALAAIKRGRALAGEAQSEWGFKPATQGGR